MVSNSYMSRVELAQLFWLIAGLFYAQEQFTRHKEPLDLAKNYD